jgi:hypothetical protein
MGKFKVTDKYVAFANAIAGGMDQYKAYIKYVAVKKDCTKGNAMVRSSRLALRPEIKAIIEKARGERSDAITQVIAREVAEEFKTTHLTVDELDSWHYAVIQGKVMVEEVIPQWTTTEIFDKQGNVVQRQRVQNFVRVSRPPNVREKQNSVDAIYKRNGDYAPSRLWAAMKNVDDPAGEENVQRVIMLSDGSTVPLLQ